MVLDLFIKLVVREYVLCEIKDRENGVGDRTLVVLVSRILYRLFDEIAHNLFQKLADAGLLFTSKL